MSKYSDKEIKWAVEQLAKKHPERANKAQAIKLLDTFRKFIEIPLSKVKKDRKKSAN